MTSGVGYVARHGSPPLVHHLYAMKLNLDFRLIFAILNGRVTTAITRALHRDFAAQGIALSSMEWTVLLYLSEREGVTQTRLCSDTFIDKPTMTRLLQAMEKKGYVRRTVCDGDKRAHHVVLTFAGRLLKVMAARVADVTLRRALRGLGHDHLVICQDVLRTIFDNTAEERGLSTVPATIHNGVVSNS